MSTESSAPPSRPRSLWLWLRSALLLAAEIVLTAVLIAAALLFSFIPFFADPAGGSAFGVQELLLRAATVFYGLSAILAVCSISQRHGRYYVDVVVGIPLALASGLWGGTLLYQALASSDFTPADHATPLSVSVAGLLYLALAGAALIGAVTRRSWWFRLTGYGAVGLIASSAALLLVVCFSLFSTGDASPAGDWKLAAAMMALGGMAALQGRVRTWTRADNQGRLSLPTQPPSESPELSRRGGVCRRARLRHRSGRGRWCVPATGPSLWPRAGFPPPARAG